MPWTIRYALKSIKQNWLRNILIVIGASLGVMLATMLLLGNKSVEQTVMQQVKVRYGDYDMQFGYLKNDMYLTTQQLNQISSLGNAEKISKALIPYPLPNHPELKGKPTYWGTEKDSPDLLSFQLLTGRYPEKGPEMAITKAYAERENIQLGDQVSMPFPPYGEKKVTVVGILNPPAMATMGHSAYFPLTWLQNELKLPDKFNLVQVKLYDMSVKGVIAYEISNRLDEVKVDQRTYKDKAFEKTNVMKPLIFSLGAVALFIVALLIMGSFFLSVRSRTKQWALLLALGSKSYQVINVILVEAILIGTIASLLGVVLGSSTHQIAATYLNNWFNVESTEPVAFTLSWDIMIVTFVLGMVMSVVGALIPAFIIRKIPPVQALRPLALDSQKEKRWNIVGIALLVLGMGLGATGSLLEPILSFHPGSIGAVLFIIGLFISIPTLIRLFVPVLSLPLRIFFKIEASLSSRYVIRYRQKAGVSIAILAFGFILLLVGNMYMTSIYEKMEEGVHRSLPADLVIRVPMEAQGTETMPFDWLAKIQRIEGVKENFGISSDPKSQLVNHDFTKADQQWLQFMKERGYKTETLEVVGTDLPTFQHITKVNTVAGQDIRTPIRDGEGVITKETASNLGLKVNDIVTVKTPNKPPQSIKIVSIIEQDLLQKGSYVFVNEMWARDSFQLKGYDAIQLMVDSKVSFDSIKEQVKKITENQENIEVMDSHSLLLEQKQLLEQMMTLIQILAGTVFIISGIGIMNSIVTSIHERRAEISVIRAVGAIPNQLSKVILLEGLLLGAISGFIGIIGGVSLGYIVLSSLELTNITLPFMLVGQLTVVSIFLGIFAALLSTFQLKQFKLSDTLKELSE